MPSKVAGRNGHAWRKVRERVKRSQRSCWICGRIIDLDVPYPEPLSFSVDHVIPLSRGGRGDDYSNCKAAHLGCNQSRGNGTVGQMRNSETW